MVQPGDRVDSGVAVSSEVPYIPFGVFADQHAIEQALMNLFVNARDASGGTGAIEVTVGRVEHAGTAHAGQRTGPHVFVEVSDAGAGMPPEVLARVFEPFFTTKSEGMGTGLGMPQIDASMRQANGYVGVSSVVGQGTRVRLCFPEAVQMA